MSGSHPSTSESPLSLFSLPAPRILSYNIRSASYYATNTRALARRFLISKALDHFSLKHEIICLQETHLAPDENFAFKRFGCAVSWNNRDVSHAGTVIIDTPSLSNFYTGNDVGLPSFTRGHVQLRHYTPCNPTYPPFQLFNCYFKSGDFDFNRKLIDAISTVPNNVTTFMCGDFNFIEKDCDSSSSSRLLPSNDFLHAWSNLKLRFNLYDPQHDSHTFFHVSEDPNFSWTSRLDRFLFPLALFNNPLITPTVSIPHHFTNLKADNDNSSSFSDHLPIHVLYDNGTVCHRDSKVIPTWLAELPEFADTLKGLWQPKRSGNAFRTYSSFKKVLFKAAALTRKKERTYRQHSLSILSIPSPLSSYSVSYSRPLPYKYFTFPESFSLSLSYLF